MKIWEDDTSETYSIVSSARQIKQKTYYTKAKQLPSMSVN